MSVKGYVIFHRHGQRAPAKNLISISGVLSEETKLWEKLVDDCKPLHALVKFMPIKNTLNNPKERDLVTFPYGNITNKGMLHLQDIGKQMSNLFPLLKNTREILVLATNYQRTQASAQMLVSGLFKDDLFPDIYDNQQQNGRSSYCSSFPNSPIEINVRDIRDCSMSFYEGKPLLSQRLFSQTQCSESFLQMENSQDILLTKESLGKFLPGLILPISNSMASIHQNNFDWLAAFDYFTCREAHNLPVHEGTEEYSAIVKSHLGLRYSHYYANMEHLAHAAVPLLEDLERSIISHKIQSNTEIRNHDLFPSNNGIFLNLFSGHDCNLLCLLYALKADIVRNSESKIDLYSQSDCSSIFWPDYGSSLVFEVSGHNVLNEKENGEGVIITAYLDLKPLSLDIGQSHHGSSFTLEDLRQRIKDLKVYMTLSRLE
mmetsp:Transcript_28513/g.27310  ORF Transcript_28513/g.27310 Transcript_28513/m.27310 type:complete len:430 (-) Transcript_28513:191-1480(-)